MHKEHAGCLLKSIRTVRSLQVKGRQDFGKGCHIMGTESYFYDSSYQLVQRDFAIPINNAGQCIVANEIEPEEGSKGIKMWECSCECKQLTDAEVAAIVSLSAFDAQMQDLRHALDTCDDGCPHGHYTKVLELAPIPVELMDDGRLTD